MHCNALCVFGACYLYECFTLSIACSYDGKVENYRVQKNEKGLVTVDDDGYFDNLIELVEVRYRYVHVCNMIGHCSNYANYSINSNDQCEVRLSY